MSQREGGQVALNNSDKADGVPALSAPEIRLISRLAIA